MDHPDYNGNKVFCGCNDDFRRGQGLAGGDAFMLGKRGYPPTDRVCPDCGHFPWYYIDKTFEPENSNLN